jgi:hypothetical protein
MTRRTMVQIRTSEGRPWHEATGTLLPLNDSGLLQYRPPHLLVCYLLLRPLKASETDDVPLTTTETVTTVGNRIVHLPQCPLQADTLLPAPHTLFPPLYPTDLSVRARKESDTPFQEGSCKTSNTIRLTLRSLSLLPPATSLKVSVSSRTHR